MLDREKLVKLAHIAEQYGGEKTWREYVEEDFDIEPCMIETLRAGFAPRRSPDQCLVCIMRGLGCPYPEARTQDVLERSVI